MVLGSQVNIFVGSCGGLQEELTKSTVIVPTYTYGDESTTRMYSKDNTENKHKINDNVATLLVDQLKLNNIHVERGSIVTCQAMLGETWEDIQEWSKNGYAGVEMETSTLFAVSNYFGVPAGAILHVADNLIEKEITVSKEYEKDKRRRDQIKELKYKIAFDTFFSFMSGE
jgi:purine-nucleoside phosphorylase